MLVSLVSKNLVAFISKVSLMFGWKLFVWSSKTLPPIFRLSLDNYYPKIKFTTELNPSKFLGIIFTNINGAYKFNVYCKNTKVPSPWNSKTPQAIRKTKSVVISLFKTKQKSSNFDEEIPLIKETLSRLITLYVSLKV